MARRMAHVHAKPAAALVAALLLLAGCGGTDRVRAKPGLLRVVLTDYRLQPQDIRIRPGETTVEVVNRGRLPHNFKVLAGEKTRIGFTTMMPGQRQSKVRTLTRGSFEIVCTVGNHRELGMYGSLRVR